jgi:hypothetical protein
VNVIRCTVVDGRGAVSFIVHGDALPALAASCSTNPANLEEFLEQAEPYYHNLRDYVLNGLAIFEERNAEEVRGDPCGPCSRSRHTSTPSSGLWTT